MVYTAENLSQLLLIKHDLPKYLLVTNKRFQNKTLLEIYIEIINKWDLLYQTEKFLNIIY